MHTLPPAFAPVTYTASLAFEALVRIRSSLYSASLIRRRRLTNPVISIGNITTGGSGKTPLVIYIAQAFLKLGWNPAILSRGYGRQHSRRTWILAPENSIISPAGILGDEPALMRRHLPSIWMGISKSRFKSGMIIAKRQPETIFLLDDGFQHRKLHRDLDVVIIDRSQPLRANRLLPRGILREPLSGLSRCHVVVINGTSETVDPDPVEAEIRSLHSGAVIFHCKQTIRSLLPFRSWFQNPSHPTFAETPRSAYLVSALGNPDRFHRDILQLGIEVRGTRSYRDHYWLKREDWLSCVNEARSRSADAIVTTEKDAVKISHPPDFPLLVSIQSTQVEEAGKFERILKDCVGKYA